MSTTNFVNGSTLSDDAWFNDVDAWTYQGVALGNINLGANYISRAGTNAGFSLDASNNATFSAGVDINGTTDATSATTGSVTLAGGIGIEKALYVGSSIVSVSGAFVGGSDNNLTLFTSTSDGTDNKGVQISSGSVYGPTRGGGIQMYGNEVASIGGNIYIDAGDTATDGSIYLRTGNNVTGIKVARTGGAGGGVVTIPNLAGSGTRTVVADANGVLSAP